MSLLELDAFIITETWQRETDLEKLICENALNLSQIGFLGLPRQNNSKKKGGGVGLLYQAEKFTCEKVSYACPKKFELCYFILTPTNICAYQKYLVGAFYIPPDISNAQLDTGLAFFRKTLTEILVKLQRPRLFT